MHTLWVFDRFSPRVPPQSAKTGSRRHAPWYRWFFKGFPREWFACQLIFARRLPVLPLSCTSSWVCQSAVVAIPSDDHQEWSLTAKSLTWRRPTGSLPLVLLGFFSHAVRDVIVLACVMFVMNVNMHSTEKKKFRRIRESGNASQPRMTSAYLLRIE